MGKATIVVPNYSVETVHPSDFLSDSKTGSQTSTLTILALISTTLIIIEEDKI